MNKFKFISFLLMFLAVVLNAAGSKADDSSFSVSVFVPTSAWLVGPATLISEAGYAMPCVMANQYNNGYVVRFSGGGNRILAMAVDFRQDVFEKEEAYDIGVEISPGFQNNFNAPALNGGTLLVNLQKYPAFYEALAGGKYLHLTVGGKQFDFALLGMEDGLRRMEQCYNPSVRPGDKKAAKVYNHASLSGGEREVKAAPVAEDNDAAASVVTGQMAALDAMLQNAAQKVAGLAPATGQGETEIAAQVQPLPQSAAQEQAATQKPIGKPLANSWLSPLVAKRGGLSQHDIMVSGYEGQDVRAFERERRWRAAKGMNLQEILDIWTRHVNARLLWNADSAFAIKESVSLEGSFEQAVELILSQYGGETRRPVGRMYNDPVLNQKVLVVETSKE